ncbi:uncharacterized protein EMH_0055220 [Eimeria mitis]|uniref:Uncharacterized protein n=1 Tax=Eimeria mitis TaxID=44415 RepID=U6JX86_9EIME|nr:uncharacterized protein EMH_0055220 [Eimeria mitis]CDJ30095.1 hypothetical protein EMH_0055220 [Eimeria mitis]
MTYFSAEKRILLRRGDLETHSLLWPPYQVPPKHDRAFCAKQLEEAKPASTIGIWRHTREQTEAMEEREAAEGTEETGKMQDTEDTEEKGTQGTGDRLLTV